MIPYLFLRLIVFVFRLTPFFIIYFYADILYFILYYVVGYRKKIVNSNLKTAFPEKDEKEITKIQKKYFKHLAIITLESFKFFSLKKNKLLKRVKILNPEIEKNFFKQKQDLIFASGHIGNWELGTSFAPLALSYELFIMYKPLKNKYIDRYVNKLRTVNNSRLVSINTPVFKYFKGDKPKALVMLGDQNPSNLKKAIWINFLNTLTACLHGIEKYSKRYNLPIVYFSFIRKKKGYYEVNLETIVSSPKSEPQGYITYKYMKRLEQDILQYPEYWLWSHKRWKHEYKSDYTLYEFYKKEVF